MPLQYYLVGIQRYTFFAIMIPVLAYIFIPSSIAIAGDTAHFLERAAKIQFGLMVCGYCLSHAPALLLLKIPGFEGHEARLLLYLGIVDQMNDLLQYVWGKLIGKNKIAWRVSPDKTWEGFLGGLVTATALVFTATDTPAMLVNTDPSYVNTGSPAPLVVTNGPATEDNKGGGLVVNNWR